MKHINIEDYYLTIKIFDSQKNRKGMKYILGIFLIISQLVIAQDTKVKDSIAEDRIDDFRDNMMNYMGQDLIDADFPQSMPLFGSKSRIAFGGYVKLDYIQDFDGGYDRFQYEIQNVPVEGDGRPDQSGYMNMHARESRFNVDFRSLTESGMPFEYLLKLIFIIWIEALLIKVREITTFLWCLRTIY